MSPHDIFDAPCKNPQEIEVGKFYHESDGLVSMEMRIPAGVTVGKHVHTYSHLSFLGKGSVLLKAGRNEPKRIDAPYCVNVEKNIEHQITAITDVVWYCTHATNQDEK